MQYDVAIVGAGVAGLVAAVELSHRGLATILLERAATPGGKLREVEIDGLPIDGGPTVFTMRPIFEELFAAAGSRLEEHLQLEPLDVLARHAWSATERFDLFADIERTVEAIAQLSGPAEARRYRAFCADAARTYATLEHSFLHCAEPGPLRLVTKGGPRALGALWQMRPFTTLWNALGDYFHDPRLRQLFGRYATYCGASPFLAPATLMLIAHVERLGVWRIAGGMQRLAGALADLARRGGATIEYAAHVERICIAHGRVAGVDLADGRRIEAGAIIVNADAAAIAAGLLGPEIAPVTPAVSRTERSLSAMTWALVGRARGFPLAHHNVFFSSDSAAEFGALRAGRLPHDPTVYVCAQDQDRLFCLVNAPAIGDLPSFGSAEIDSCATRTFDRLARCSLEIERDPARTIVTTPSDFARNFPGSGGALYGRACHGWKSAFERPTARTRVPGLYLAGGSTHPGAGLPMVALSGRFAAASLLADRASTHRFHGTATPGGTLTR